MRKFDLRKLRFKKIKIEQMDDRLLLINLLFTQFLAFSAAIIIIWFQKTNYWPALFSLESGWSILVWGMSFAAVVLLIDYLLRLIVPSHIFDDGGINEMIFGNRPLWQIITLSLIVAACEELLFRGAIQHTLGPLWTSIIFTLIHFRYLRHWLMAGFVFIISYGLGWLFIYTGTIWTPIVAHFMIDLTAGCLIRYQRNR